MLTPTAALAACICSSAERTSGRCSTSFEGRLTGSSSGNCSDESSNSAEIVSLGKLPMRRASRSRCCASCFSRRQRRLGLRQRRLLRNYVGIGDLAECELPPQQFQRFSLDIDDLPGCCYLAAQTGLLYG